MCLLGHDRLMVLLFPLAPSKKPVALNRFGGRMRLSPSSPTVCPINPWQPLQTPSQSAHPYGSRLESCYWDSFNAHPRHDSTAKVRPAHRSRVGVVSFRTSKVQEVWVFHCQATRHPRSCRLVIRKHAVLSKSGDGLARRSPFLYVGSGCRCRLGEVRQNLSGAGGNRTRSSLRAACGFQRRRLPSAVPGEAVL